MVTVIAKYFSVDCWSVQPWYKLSEREFDNIYQKP